MKTTPLIATAVLLMAAPSSFAEDPVKTPVECTTVNKVDSLRKPGFIFLELGTSRLDDYVAFFQEVAGFHLVQHQPHFITMESGLAQLMLLDPVELPKGHPFHQKLTGTDQGLGVEIGIVMADLDKTFNAATKFKDKSWKISSGIAMRPWGVRDFRVLAPDGYYLRFTESPK